MGISLYVQEVFQLRVNSFPLESKPYISSFIITLESVLENLQVVGTSVGKREHNRIATSDNPITTTTTASSDKDGLRQDLG